MPQRVNELCGSYLVGWFGYLFNCNLISTRVSIIIYKHSSPKRYSSMFPQLFADIILF